jgi:hypothetical protein
MTAFFMRNLAIRLTRRVQRNQDNLAELLLSGELVRFLDVLESVADEGLKKRDRREVEDAIATILVLFLCPIYAYKYTIPPDFWQTELGIMIAKCQVAVHGENLITLTEATQMMYGDADGMGVTKKALLSRVKRMVLRGELTAYYDPNTANPQHATRVHRHEVEMWKERNRAYSSSE